MFLFELHWLITAVLVIVVLVLAKSNILLWIELKAMKASTHTLTYIDPLQQQYSQKPQPKKETDEIKVTDDPFGNIALHNTREVGDE